LDRIPVTNLLTPVDHHTSPSIGTRKPDTVIYLANSPMSVFNIVAIGENKRRRKKQEFDDEEKGHLVEHMKTLLQEQPFRLSVTGYLSDGKLIQFFRLEQKERGSPCTLTESAVMFLSSDGAKAFFGLLHCNPKDLGYSVPTVVVASKTLILENILGTGASSIVYRGRHEDKAVVVKNFRSISTFRLVSEERNLKTIAPLVPRVPELVAVSDDNQTLILSPIGTPFAITFGDIQDAVGPDPAPKPLITANHFSMLIDILHDVHNNFGLVHRDVAIHNMFLDSSGVAERL
jgi:hypothetical protein